MTQSRNIMSGFFLIALPSFVIAGPSAPLIIRQSSIYDYPQNFEEIYAKDIVVEPPAAIASFVERPVTAE